VSGPRQLLVYEFGPDAEYEGRLLGALERIEGDASSRVLDGLFVGIDADTGALEAIDLRSGGPSQAVARLLTFRLDPSARRRATERALGDSGSVPAATLRELAGALEPGGALVALLVERVESDELDEAVSHSGGWALGASSVEAASLAEIAPELATRVSSRRRS
jgi:hypothetical protein